MREGTGFFMDGNHGYTYAHIFKNASSAQVITVDSTVHKVTKINGFDPSTGLTRLDLDNMLSAKISKLSSTKDFPKEGASLKVLYAKGTQNVSSSSTSISKKTDFIGYGSAIQTGSKLDSKVYGSPVLNSSGNAIGIVVPIDNSGNEGFIIGTNSLINLKTVSQPVNEFGGSFKVNNFLIQGIHFYMNGQNEQSLSAFGKAKSTMPNHVTAFYYSGLLNYEAEKIGAARSDFNKAIQLDPTLEQAYFIRGQINYNNEDYKTAIADLTEADLTGADLEGANLILTVFNNACLEQTNFKGAQNLTPQQIVRAHTLYQTTLDEVIIEYVTENHPRLLAKPDEK